MCSVYRRPTIAVPGNSPPNSRNEVQVPITGHALDQAVDDAEAVAREQVVGERVSGEALAHREDEEGEPDDPVELTRLAERSREEDAQHVQADGGDEQQRGPVVHLAHEEPAADVERDVERRRHRDRHLDALEGHVGAVVVHLGHRGLEEEGEERARDQDDDEAEERDLAEEERPVVGERLASELLDEAGEAGAIVDVDRRGCRERPLLRNVGGRCDYQFRSQKLGPTGSLKSLCAMR